MTGEMNAEYRQVEWPPIVSARNYGWDLTNPDGVMAALNRAQGRPPGTSGDASDLAEHLAEVLIAWQRDSARTGGEDTVG